MRIDGWEGDDPVRCLGAQRWTEQREGHGISAGCKVCGATSRLREDHVVAALEGTPYNVGWREFRPKLGRWQHENEGDGLWPSR